MSKGTSVDSGLPSFTGSGADSVWNNHNISDVCNYNRWKTLVGSRSAKHHQMLNNINQFYEDMYQAVKIAGPNSFHQWIGDLERSKQYNVVILTTNVDDLFEKAGCTNVIHLHGEIGMYRCTICGRRTSIKTTRCPSPKCNSRYIKTDVTFYCEVAEKQYLKALRQFDILQRGDFMIAAGTSARTFQMSRTAWKEAKERGVKTIHINPNPGPMLDYPADEQYVMGKYIIHVSFINPSCPISSRYK
ncbi:MAG: hypothetical protein EOP45_13470 [Sphingobacteriaceae bacterium]|nr:MAG: hypothetical protein EOP45_13470 [Sphingobacteriaceae bacterium]